MHFSKPYPTDYRKPKDAEAILENQLQLTFSLLKEKGIKVRVWSFDKPRIIKNTTKFKTNTIGFYAIKGESVIAKFLKNKRSQ